jgi:hypothetical protein
MLLRNKKNNRPEVEVDLAALLTKVDIRKVLFYLSVFYEFFFPSFRRHYKRELA